jgi:hypothetical protein
MINDFTLLYRMISSVVEVIISSDNKSGTLKLAGTGGISGNDKVYGTVSMLREESGWKINRDEWSNKQH